MRFTLAVLGAALLVVGCGAGSDGTSEGTRGACSRGGVLEPCPPIDHTPEAACTRLVQCGAIPEQAPQDYQFDWDRCVDHLEGLTTTAADLVISCIAASSCDILRSSNPQDPDPRDMACVRLGGGF